MGACRSLLDGPVLESSLEEPLPKLTESGGFESRKNYPDRKDSPDFLVNKPFVVLLYLKEYFSVNRIIFPQEVLISIFSSCGLIGPLQLFLELSETNDKFQMIYTLQNRSDKTIIIPAHLCGNRRWDSILRFNFSIVYNYF